MPNWVKNKVRPVNKEDTGKLIAMLLKKKDGEHFTNFDGIIPMPKELRDFERWHGDPECEKKAAEMKAKYGCEDWYEWACDKWGTKWDNNEADIYQSVIEFNTAWSAPCGVYREISKKIPLVVAFADEDIGVNFGIALFLKNGISWLDVDGTDEQIANAIWGFYSEDMEAEGEISEEVNKKVDEIIYGDKFDKIYG